MQVFIHTDGGSRGNPGPAASAFTVHSSENAVIFEKALFLGTATNNVAEYSALRMAMEWLLENRKTLNITEADILMDSELVVKQMRGEYKIKDSNLQLLATNIKRIQQQFEAPVHFIHVRRSENKRADELVNIELDAQHS